jgi:hypothetical protein
MVMMADTILTLDTLNETFQRLTMTMLGLSQSSQAINASAYKVRLSWPEDGAPAWKKEEDVCFIQCYEVDDAYNRQRNEGLSKDNLHLETSYTSVNQVGWIFYGPNSYANAKLVKDSLFTQTIRDSLKRVNVFLIPDLKSPMRAPELFQNQWWPRVDFTAHFNELVIRRPSADLIQSATISLNNAVIAIQKED